MTLQEILESPTIRWPLITLAAGCLVLVGIQMFRGDALVCADGSILAKSCPTAYLPRGTVIAVDHQDGCPAGWSVHEDARGRFIVGVGRHSEFNEYGTQVSEKRLRETGGQDQVRLETRHMPSHSHRNPSRGSDGNRQVNALQAVGEGEYGGRHSRPTEATGDDEPHENMPPYIAFYFCTNS